eukprot:CAMPEP_0194564638 /NCGR_PEP_ID=MMETSP0292-20121207/4210_1 /TAXON_ID=39354 /ORGANISM="Heterosigma akashiwo, Strain CCMP2393" /LENGTH=104 /DNA_ID=CAMNT_0039413801 /DNA_START=432 /DNA_END=746 /DNA_ORIENTATION=-
MPGISQSELAFHLPAGRKQGLRPGPPRGVPAQAPGHEPAQRPARRPGVPLLHFPHQAPGVPHGRAAAAAAALLLLLPKAHQHSMKNNASRPDVSRESIGEWFSH